MLLSTKYDLAAAAVAIISLVAGAAGVRMGWKARKGN